MYGGKLIAALCLASALVAAPAEVRTPWGGKRAVLPKLKLVKKFDKDGDGRLNSAERQKAMAYLEANPRTRRKGRGPRGGVKKPPPSGPELGPEDVKKYAASVSLFDRIHCAPFFCNLRMPIGKSNWPHSIESMFCCRQH